MPSNTGKAKGGAGTSRRKQLDVSSGPTPGSVAPEEEGDELLDGALADDGSSEPDEPTANADTENSDDGDEVDAALDDALTDDDGADSEAEGEAPAADAVMAAKFDALENLVLKLSTRTEKLTALALKQQDTIRDLRQQVRRIDGEPVVTSNVSNRSSSFARRTSAPQPPSSVRKQTPGSISGAKVADAHNFDDDPETATLMMALARQKASIQTN